MKDKQEDLSLMVDKYMAEIILRGYSKNTAYYYKTIIDKFVKFCKKNNITLKNIPDMNILDFLQESKHLKKSSLNIYQEILRSLIKYLVENKAISGFPIFRKIVYNKKVPLFFTEKTLGQIKEVLQGDLEELIIGILTETGVRVSELCSLKKSDINWNSGSIIVRNTKGNADRTVFISQTTAKKLFEYSRRSSAPELLHKIDKKNLTRLDVYYILKRIGKRIGLKVTPHSIRHSFARTFYRANKGDIRLLQIALGHKSISTTETYLSVLGSELKQGFSNTVNSMEKGGEEGGIVSS